MYIHANAERVLPSPITARPTRTGDAHSMDSLLSGCSGDLRLIDVIGAGEAVMMGIPTGKNWCIYSIQSEIM